jgi:hypothetical protein
MAKEKAKTPSIDRPLRNKKIFVECAGFQVNNELIQEFVSREKDDVKAIRESMDTIRDNQSATTALVKQLAETIKSDRDEKKPYINGTTKYMTKDEAIKDMWEKTAVIKENHAELIKTLEPILSSIQTKKTIASYWKLHKVKSSLYALLGLFGLVILIAWGTNVGPVEMVVGISNAFSKKDRIVIEHQDVPADTVSSKQKGELK